MSLNVLTTSFFPDEMKVRRFSEPIKAYKRRSSSSRQESSQFKPAKPESRETTWREELQTLEEFLEKEGGEELNWKVSEVEVRDQEIPAATANVSQKLEAASEAWQQLPTASKQAKSIVKYGVLVNCNLSGKYEEKNNKSYVDNEEFGLSAIQKLMECGSAARTSCGRSRPCRWRRRRAANPGFASTSVTWSTRRAEARNCRCRRCDSSWIK